MTEMVFPFKMSYLNTDSATISYTCTVHIKVAAGQIWSTTQDHIKFLLCIKNTCYYSPNDSCVTIYNPSGKLQDF